jgi:hypothetical protein
MKVTEIIYVLPLTSPSMHTYLKSAYMKPTANERDAAKRVGSRSLSRSTFISLRTGTGLFSFPSSYKNWVRSPVLILVQMVTPQRNGML